MNIITALIMIKTNNKNTYAYRGSIFSHLSRYARLGIFPLLSLSLFDLMREKMVTVVKWGVERPECFNSIKAHLCKGKFLIRESKARANILRQFFGKLE